MAVSSEQIRNLAVAGHAGSGKTILSESILFRQYPIITKTRLPDKSR